MARRTKFVDAALRAVIEGQSKFHFFGKERLVDDWLTPDQKNNAQALLSKRLSDKQAEENAKSPTPKPAVMQPSNKTSATLKIYGDTHINKSLRWDPSKDACFIIANGESRKGFDLTKLKDKGYIVGMNVLPLIAKVPLQAKKRAPPLRVSAELLRNIVSFNPSNIFDSV